MKYLLLICLYILMTGYLIVERLVKIGVFIFMILWNFKWDKKLNIYWKPVFVVLPAGTQSRVWVYAGLKKYYNFTSETIF